MLEEIRVSTQKHYQLVNITDKIRDIVKKSRIEKGIVVVYSIHTTASVLVTEDEDGLKKDWLRFFQRLVSHFDFLHNRVDNNGDSHILAGLVGPEKDFIVKNGDLILGTWQSIFLAEFDGPRERSIFVKIIQN